MRNLRLQILAKKMRRDPTRAEFLLWQKLRSRKLGVKFLRQKVVMGYILDFYCHQARLGIEVDGSTHDETRDLWRDSVIHERGIVVLRFSNQRVVTDGLSVVREIEDCLDRLLEGGS